MSVDVTTAKIKPPKKRRVWRWALGILLFILLVAAILAAIIWVNRYALMEDMAKDALAKQGIEAELSIASVTKTHAVLKDIALSSEGEAFFSAKKITADYSWREAVKGQMQKLVFTAPKARLSIDGKGQIIDGWLPPTSADNGGGFALPPQGLHIEDGAFSITSPYGNLAVLIEANILARDNFTAKLDIAPAQFSYKDYKFDGGGKLDITLQGDSPDIRIDARLTSLSHPVIDTKGLTLKGGFTPKLGQNIRAIEGKLDITFDSILMAQVETGSGGVSWDGRITQDIRKQHPLGAKGRWQLDVNSAAIPDPARRRELAHTLSLADALLKTPIAENFSAELTDAMTNMLRLSDVSGSGDVDLNSAGLIIEIDDDMHMGTSGSQLTLSRNNTAPLYRYSRDEGAIALNFNAELTRPAGLAFRNAKMLATSENGWRITAIDSFSADIRTQETWRSKDAQGRSVRLSPFFAKTNYKVEAASRQLGLHGNVDYDGPLPGGFVTGLVTKGQMNMNLSGPKFSVPKLSVTYRPDNAAPIKITRFDTDTDWRGEDITTTLVSDTPIYRRKGDKARITGQFKDTALIAIDNTDSRNLGMTFETLDVDGTLTEARQNWDIEAEAAKICSEDMPGPGTDIRMPRARLSVLREEDGIRFNMSSLDATAKTQLVYANNLAVEISGTPQHYTLHYRPGAAGSLVKFTGDALPPLPMTGQVTYNDRAFVGAARTQLPLTTDTPIDIDYRFKDGSGTADVNIPQLVFSPKGLQPQYLVSALKGKIADVEGLVSAKIKLAFAAGQPLQSSGSVKFTDMNFGTLPGPLEGVTSEMEFTSMLPLQSQGRQRLTVKHFDPGFPLEDGVIEFALIPDGVKVYSARWPLGDGFFSLDPFDWLYTAPQNKVVMRIENVSLGEFLNNIGDGALEATGNISGALPITLAGIDVKVEGGVLEVKDGGTIRYQSPQTNAAGASSEYAEMAFNALKDFRYQKLYVKVDGPLDGSIDVGLTFGGKNKDVLGGQPFLFDVNIQGELLNIARSFNTNAQIKAELARRQLSSGAP